MGANRQSLLEAAKIEIGLRHFLKETGSHAFTDTFEDLHGLTQLPGIAVQRLMADGYGFGAEGDWKTAALVRAAKVMSHGLKGGSSFMEDYTYHLKDGAQVLGAHMLEVCPSITSEKPSAEIHSLSIGGKADPVRLVFTAATGKAVNASIVDMGSRFRLIVNQVNVIQPQHSLPKLPVARAIWIPEPNLEDGGNSMDTRWRRTSHGAKPCLDAGAPGEFRRTSWHGMSADRCQHHRCRLREGASLERCVLPLREWTLSLTA